MLNYILDENKNPIPVTIHEWAIFFKNFEARIVKQEDIGDMQVSTVFLGIDHGFGLNKRPILFETMIFGGELDQEEWRYCTWDEAIKGHDEAVRLVKESQNKDVSDENRILI